MLLRAWGTVGQDCQRIKTISQTFRRNTLQTTAVRSPPLICSEKEKKQVNSRKRETIFKLNEHRIFPTAYVAMHTGARCTLSKSGNWTYSGDRQRAGSYDGPVAKIEILIHLLSPKSPSEIWEWDKCVWMVNEAKQLKSPDQRKQQMPWTIPEGSSNHNDRSLLSPLELPSKRKKGG